MCGRYFFQLDESVSQWREQIAQLDLFDFRQGEVFPGQKILALSLGEKEQIQPHVFQWGMPGYQGRLLINARSEGIEQKVTFRPWLHQRCVVLANGFYEWAKQGSEKKKIYIRKADSKLIYLAGIYNDKGECVIVTGAAEQEMVKIHHRTPIILKESAMHSYLSLRTDFIIDNEHLLFEAV